MNMKYLKKLSGSILDEHNVFVEFLLAWIAGILTLFLVIWAVTTIASALGG
jgi:hypothetical protein